MKQCGNYFCLKYYSTHLILYNNEQYREEITGEPNSDLIFSITDDDPITPPEQDHKDHEDAPHIGTVNTSNDENDENSVTSQGEFSKPGIRDGLSEGNYFATTSRQHFTSQL